jgi:hypothetical protein
MEIEHNTRTVTTRQHTMTVTGEELLDAINQEIKAMGKTSLPRDAEIIVNVPGGGDWSNTELDLREYPVIVKWTEVEED